MKRLLIAVLILIALDLTLSRCANPISPTGGPKDSIPPSLVTSIPLTGTINFKNQEIQMEFTEFINADKLNQNLIITPKTDIKFKHIVKRNKLTIKFEEPFTDSTTFSLNFFDGVTDITEKTPAVNLILAFSTGGFIDSMRVEGEVQDLLSQKPSKEFIVGLYPITDTLDFFKENPTYFTTVNDSGKFSLSYIKTGDYKLLAFKDGNRNLLLDPKEEEHGFTADTLALYDSINSISIATILQNVKPLELVNNRPIRSYHEIKFNRDLDNYSFLTDTLYSAIVGDAKDIIRIYNPGQFEFGDTTQLVLTAADSLSNVVHDTLKIVFNEYESRPTEFKVNPSYQPKTIENNPSYTIKFNKPVLAIDSSKFIFGVDSTFTMQPDSLEFKWNSDKTNLVLQTFINKDSMYNAQVQALPLDTMIFRSFTLDSLLSLPVSTQDSIKQLAVNKTSLEFRMKQGAFISVESDTSRLSKISHKRTVQEAFGTLKLIIQTEKKSFFIQLLNSRGEVAYETKNNLQPSFDIRPATYSIRVLIDTNGDGKWSFGNLLTNTEPEEVYLFPEKIAVRENWIVEDIELVF